VMIPRSLVPNAVIRFVEYSISASVMIVAIGLQLGIFHAQNMLAPRIEGRLSTPYVIAGRNWHSTLRRNSTHDATSSVTHHEHQRPVPHVHTRRTRVDNYDNTLPRRAVYRDNSPRSSAPRPELLLNNNNNNNDNINNDNNNFLRPRRPSFVDSRNYNKVRACALSCCITTPPPRRAPASLRTPIFPVGAVSFIFFRPTSPIQPTKAAAGTRQRRVWWFHSTQFLQLPCKFFCQSCV
jgi:hypothetical protein